MKAVIKSCSKFIESLSCQYRGYIVGISGKWLFKSYFNSPSRRASHFAAMIFAVLVMSMANIGTAWGASGTITAASTTDLGKGNTPRYVVEQAGVGRLMKNATGSSSWSDSDGKLTTGSSLFALQTYNAISSIIIYGNGTGKDRTFSSMRVGTTTSNYASAEATGSGTMSSGGAINQTITITPSSNIAANSYVEITLSGNINIYSVELVYATSCAATANAGADKSTTVGVGVAMAATAASSGYTGAWSIKAGSPSTETSQLSSTSSATATFTPTAVGTYTLVWTVTDNSDGTCSASDEATVTVSASGGDNDEVCVTFGKDKNVSNGSNTTTVNGLTITTSGVGENASKLDNDADYIIINSGDNIIETFKVYAKSEGPANLYFSSDGETYSSASTLSLSTSYAWATYTSVPDNTKYIKIQRSDKSIYLTEICIGVASGDDPGTTYTITYNLGREKWVTGYTPASTYTAGEEYTLPTSDNLTKENDGTFQGWYDNEGLTGDAVTTISTTATGNKTYYAKWVYVIKFFEVVDEATDVENKEFNKPLTDASYPTTYTYGVGITLPELPAKDGYTAAGWYSQWCVCNEQKGWVDACKFTALDNNAYGNVNFAVKYTANTYTITWDANGGNETPESSTYTYDGSAVELPTPTRDGYTFNGWFTEATGGTKITEIGTTNKPTSDVTYYAQWTTSEDPEPDDCHAGTLFSAEVAANSKQSFAAGTTTELTSAQATITGGKMYAINQQDAAKNLISETDDVYHFYLTNNNTFFKLELNCNLKAGDVITIDAIGGEDSSENPKGLWVYTNSTRPDNAPACSGTSSTKSLVDNIVNYTVTTGDIYVGKNVLYIYRAAASSTHFNNINITRPEEQAETYNVTIQPNNANYGSVSHTSIANVTSGTSITANGNQLTIGETTITATPTAQTAQYTYAFGSWSWEPAGETITAATTVTANFTHTTRSYDVTATLANVTVNEAFPANIEYGSSIERTITAADGCTLPETITVTGANHTWDSSTGALSITNVTGAVTITIEGNNPATTLYTVTFNTNGGSSVDAITQALAGAAITMPAAPTKSGYEFIGWFIGETSLAAGASYTPTANVTAYAAWQAECTASGGEGNTIFLWNHDGSSTYGGSNGIHDMTGEVSGTIKFVTYEGKSTGNDGTIQYNDNVTDSDLKPSITEALKLGNDGAHLCITPASGNFKAGDIIYICGHTPVLITTSSDPTSTDKIREGTVLSSKLTLGSEKGDCNIGTLILPATFSETDKIYISRADNSVGIAAIKVVRPSSSGTGECYYVTYDGNGADGGYVNDPTAYYSGSNTVTVQTNTFTRTGYTFAGWNTAADGTGTPYAAGTTFPISANTTLYAQWVEKEAVTYDVTYNLNGGTGTTPTQAAVAEGTEITLAEAKDLITKEGYIFAGWKYGNNIYAAGGTFTMPANEVTFTAQWSEDKNLVYYYKDSKHFYNTVYKNPEGNVATIDDNQKLTSSWTIRDESFMDGLTSVVANDCQYDGKNNYMNAYIKLPIGGNATTKNIVFTIKEGYLATIKIKMGGYSSNPTVTLKPYANETLDNAISYTGSFDGYATNEDAFGELVWSNLNTGVYVLNVTGKNAYISQIDVTTKTTCTEPTTTLSDGTCVIGETLDLTTLISNPEGEGAITYEITSGSGASINGSTFTATQSGAVTITATQAADETYCQKVMTATIVVSAPIDESGCSQYFTFVTKNSITNPTGQQGSKYLQLTDNYATATGLDATLGKVGIKDIATDQSKTTTLIDEEEIYFPNTSTYLKVEYMSKDLAAGDQITITTDQSSETEYIFTTAGTKCAENCITTSDQIYTIPAGSSLIGANTFYIWASTAERYLKTITICRPVNDINITYSANGGIGNDVTIENNNIVANCTFTAPIDKEFSGWNTAEDGSGTAYAVGDEVTESTTLYAQWVCIVPQYTINYVQTEYTTNAVASAITVTVTSGNVTSYQWYSGTTNNREEGSSINGETSASFTPPTNAAGKTYYWCSLTNACETYKTNAIPITVSAVKTTPTVTWTDPTTEVNYGGGGYSISATVNEDDWDGTLTASMLTAPAGVNLYNITIDGKTITANFDVTTAYERTKDDIDENYSIPFYLTLPETDEYSQLVNTNEVIYDECMGVNVGKVIPVLEAITDATEEVTPRYYWETSGVGKLLGLNYGKATCESTQDAQFTGDGFNYIAATSNTRWVFQPYLTGIKKIRLYVKSSNSDLQLSSIGGKSEWADQSSKYASLETSSVTYVNSNLEEVENFTNDVKGYIEVELSSALEKNYYYLFTMNSYSYYVYGIMLCAETSDSEGISPTLSFESGNVTKEQSDANFTNVATKTTNTLGAITYTSSNPDCATVDPTTGEVEITATGEADMTTTITATLAPSGCYKGATASYTITVKGIECDISAGTLTASATSKCADDKVTLTLTGFTEENTTIEWYNGETIVTEGYTTDGSTSTLTTSAKGTYSVLVKHNTETACVRRSNSVTVKNISVESSATKIVNKWYIKNERLTPDIALWELGEGTEFISVSTSDGWATGTGFGDGDIFPKDGVVYLTGKAPNANTEEDITYTLTLTVKDICGNTTSLSEQTITIIHQKNTDKHVLAFVATGTEKGEFTEGIPAAQSSNLALYTALGNKFDVQATNIYSTDDEKALKEYYSQFDIICITDYPDSKKTGVNGISYTNAMGSLIDIRPILTMEAWVSKYSNWNAKGVKGNPKSPTTRQYSMLLQCKDHEIFSNTSLVSEIKDGETMYRVTMVDKNKEDYLTLDKVEEDPHQEKAGYKYGSNPALQGFTYTTAMSDMLPIGIIDDGAGNNLQVGLERQHEIAARMMVLGVNSYAMERLTSDGQTVIINTLNYLMKKKTEEIADCSIYFIGGDNTNEAGPTAWSNPKNWRPTHTLPQSSQEARILAPCVVSDIVAKAASVKIVTDGTYAPGYGENGAGFQATGCLTIAHDGALIVGRRIVAATAPNYYSTRSTTVKDLSIGSAATGNGTLIFNNDAGDTKAGVAMYSIAYTDEANIWNWQYVGTPHSDVNNALYNYYNSWLYSWNGSGWSEVPTGGAVYPWVGYCITYPESPHTYWMEGTLVETTSQEIEVPAKKSMVVANSWTAPIQIANFEDDDFDGISKKTIYLFNTGSDPEGKGEVNNATAENRYAAGTYISIPIHAAPYTGDATISSMQGFYVRNSNTTAGTLHLDYSKLVRPKSGQSVAGTPMRAPKRIAAKEDEPLVAKLVVRGSRYDDKLIILEREDFTLGYDSGWDGEKLDGGTTPPTIWAVNERKGVEAVMATPDMEGTIIGFRAGEDSEYTIYFDYDGMEEALYLLDTDTQIYTRILNGNSYTFTCADKGEHNRFILTRKAPEISTGVDSVNGKKTTAKKFIKDDKIFIFVNGTLYDATGKMVVR